MDCSYSILYNTFYFSQNHNQESPIPSEYVSESSRLNASLNLANESPSIEEFSHHLQQSANTSQERTSTEVSVSFCGSLLKSNQWLCFFPGLGYTDYMQTYYSVIRFHSKQVDILETPFQRVSAKEYLW